MCSEEASPTGDASGQFVPTDTLDFLFEYTREAPQRQLAAMDALDNKAFALFSASAVVVGLASVGIWGRQEVPSGAGVLLVLAVAAFIVVAYTARQRQATTLSIGGSRRCSLARVLGPGSE